jgi:hypothetical protein
MDEKVFRLARSFRRQRRARQEQLKRVLPAQSRAPHVPFGKLIRGTMAVATQIESRIPLSVRRGPSEYFPDRMFPLDRKQANNNECLCERRCGPPQANRVRPPIVPERRNELKGQHANATSD